MPCVLVTPPMIRGTVGRYTRVLAEAGFEIAFPQRSGDGKVTNGELRDAAGSFDAILGGSETYDAEVLATLDGRLRVLARHGVGYDGVDVAAATAADVMVAYSPGSNHEAVGEHVLGMVLALYRRLCANDADVRSGQFERRAVRPLRGRTLGIVGLGRTGSAVAERAAAFDLHVIACDPYIGWDRRQRLLARPAERDELLAAADVVTLHVPRTAETLRLIREETIARMKPGAVLVNCARGGVVDEADLAAALTGGHLSGAAVDVFESEPPTDSPLLAAPNVLLSPHVAGIDDESVERMSEIAAENIVALHRGERPEGRLVNGADLPHWRWSR